MAPSYHMIAPIPTPKFRVHLTEWLIIFAYRSQSEGSSSGNPRGSIHLQGALICPSDEDSHTFSVNSSSGEMFKLRATDARARQEWVNKLRSVAEYHSSNVNKVSTKEIFILPQPLQLLRIIVYSL